MLMAQFIKPFLCDTAFTEDRLETWNDYGSDSFSIYIKSLKLLFRLG